MDMHPSFHPLPADLDDQPPAKGPSLRANALLFVAAVAVLLIASIMLSPLPEALMAAQIAGP